MTAFPLDRLSIIFLEKVINKFDEKSYFRLQQTCKGVRDFIRSNKSIEVHIRRKSFSGLKRYLKNLSEVKKQESLDITTVFAVRLDDVKLMEVKQQFQQIYTELKENRITCTHLTMYRNWLDESNFTMEQCRLLIEVLKPARVYLNSTRSYRFEALFHAEKLKEAAIMLDLKSTELLRATARLLSKIHTVRLYTKREKMNLEQFYDFSQTILQLCGSLENKRLLLRVTSEEGRELPSVDELRENFSGYSPSFEQKMMSSPEAAPCQVCGKPSARKRYHGVVCNACRVFFFRYSTTKSRFSCSFSNNCRITHKKQRLNCSSCRLKKCLEVNMYKDEIKKDAVGSLYLSRNSYAPMKKLMEMYGGIMNNGFKIIGSLKRCQNVINWVDCMAHFDSQLLVRGGPSPSSAVADTSMSLTEMLMFPGNCIDRATTACDAFSNLNSSVPYKLMETVCRVFVASIEIMSLVEEFHLLPPTDRLKLLQQNGLMLSAYLLFYFKFTQGWGSNPSLQYLSRFQLADGVASFWKSVISLWASLSCIKIDEILKETQPSEEEFMLLRIRSLFRPCPELTSEGNVIAIQTRLKLAFRLGEYIKERFPSFSNQEVQRRLCQLLELETHLKDIGSELNNTLLTLTTQGTNGFGTPLSHDIFVRKF